MTGPHLKVLGANPGSLLSAHSQQSSGNHVVLEMETRVPHAEDMVQPVEPSARPPSTAFDFGINYVSTQCSRSWQDPYRMGWKKKTPLNIALERTLGPITGNTPDHGGWPGVLTEVL